MAVILPGYRNKRGYALWSGGDGLDKERDTITCSHCCKVVFLEPGKPPPGGCHRCSGLLCEECTINGKCTPYEKEMDRIEKAITENLERQSRWSKILWR